MSDVVFDELDRKIMRELEEDGRRSNVEIAKAVGTSEGTVRRRIETILASGTGKIVLTFNPRRLGLNVEIFLALGVDLDKLEEVASKLAQCDEVNYVGLTTGDFDIVVHAVFHNNDEVFNFINEKIGSINGIQSSRTSFVLKATKRSRRWTPVEPIHLG